MKSTITTKLNRFFVDYPLKRYSQGDIIVFADGTIPPVMYLTKGRVGQYNISENGTKTVLTIFQPPAFFPMLNAVNKIPNKHFYEAITDVQLRVAPADDVVVFLQEEPEVMYDLLCRLYSGVEGLLGKLSNLMAGTARSRLVLELSLAAERFGVQQDDGSMLLRMTESQLAQQTGLARETVSRELQKLKKEGVITTTKGVISVHGPLGAPLPV